MRSIRALTLAVLSGALIAGSVERAAAQGLNVTPQALSFVYQIGGTQPISQYLFVTGDTPTGLSVTTSGAPWITIAPATGTTPLTLTVTARPPLDATPGTLTGSIIIGPVASVDAVRLVVPVSLTILASAQGDLVVAPSSLTFDYRIGGAVPGALPVSVTSTGANPAAFNVSSGTTSGGLWLATAASSLVTPSTVYVSITPSSGLTPGTYTGTVSIIPSSAGAASKQVKVTLRVSAGGSLSVSPSYLAFESQVGGSTPQPQYLLISSSTASAFTVSANTTSGGLWIVCTPTTGITPTSISVSVYPTGLAPGVYYGTVTLRPNNGAALSQIPITLTVVNSPQVQISPPSLSFDNQAGGPTSTQYLYVTTTGAPIQFNSAVTGPSWVTVPAGTYRTPAGVPISVTPPGATPPGIYNAIVTMTPTGGSAFAVSAQIQITVQAANTITLTPNIISFVYSIGGAAPAQMVSVNSSNNSAPYQVSSSVSWLNVTPTSQYTPGSISVAVVPKDLAVGNYNGTVTVFSEEASNSPQTISVTLTVSADASLTTTPFGLMFSYQLGGTAPPPQLAVINMQSGSREFTVRAETASGGSWLMTAGGGTTPSSVAAAIDAKALTVPGTYSGHIVVKSTAGSSPDLQIPVIVNVTAGPNLVTPTGSLAFQYAVGGPAVASQKLPVAATTSYIGFYPSLRTSDGGGWLKVTPDFATTPADLTVSVDPTGLQPGYYLGLLVLNGIGQEPLLSYVPVSLQVSTGPILTVPAQSLLFQSDVGGPITAPQLIAVRSTGAPANIQVSGSSSGWLMISPANAFGNVDVSVQAFPDALGSAFYLGLVQIEIPGIANTQQYVPVGFIVRNPMTQ